MVNSITESTPYTSNPNGPVSGSHSICYAGIPDQMVTSAVDAIISRMAPAYLELMREAKENPEIISDYKSSLYDQYKNMSLTPEIRADVMEAQRMSPDCNVITKTLPSKSKISVFPEKNKFNENQALDKAKLHIRLWVKTKDIKEEDPLDHLLSQLSKKIFSKGYGDEGTFDIRLEKGHLCLEGDSWKWHFDGEFFKTSITVCYSNQKNWSTRVSGSSTRSDGKPADHGFLYDALNVYHRAPIPSDLGEELNADDYRLFIRYIDAGKKEEKKIPSLLFDDEYEIKKLNTFSDISQETTTILPSNLTKYNFSKLSEEFKTHHEKYSLSQVKITKVHFQPIVFEMESALLLKKNTGFSCIVM